MTDEWATAFCDLWNQHAKPAGLRGCVARVAIRDGWKRRQIQKCWTLSDNLEEWGAGFAVIASDPFAIGDNSRGWRANLDYVLRDQNIARVLEDGILASEEKDAGISRQRQWLEDQARKAEEARGGREY